MKTFNLLISLLLLVPTNWALSMASSVSSPSASSSLSPLSSAGSTKDSTAAATFGEFYRKSRQSRCVRCYEDRSADDYDRTRYGSYSPVRGSGGYNSRSYDDRASYWYYPNERYDRYDDRVRYAGDKDYDRYNYNYYGYTRDRNDDRYSTRTYDRYDRDRYDSRYSYDRSPSENRGYGYDNRDRYYLNDRSNDYYRGGDRYADRNRGGSSYDRYGLDDRYYSRYDFRNYRPLDETYRGQSGFDSSGRGYYFANERPTDYHDSHYQPHSRPSGPSTPGPTYLPGGDSHEQSRPSNSHGYANSRPGTSSSSSSSSSPSSSSSSSSLSPASSSSGGGADYGNHRDRPRDDVHGLGSGGVGANSGGDNHNGYTSGSSWSYVNDREKDTSYKGGIRDKDNQSPSYGGGGRGRPLGGSYLLDRDTNIPETSMVSNQDKPDESNINDSPTASKLSSPSSTSLADTKDSN